VSGLRWTVLALRLVAEIGLIGGLAYWGAKAGEGAVGAALAVGAPVAAALVWGLFVSPKAKRPVPRAVRVSIEIDLFVLAAVALWFVDAEAAAIALGTLGVATSLANLATEREGIPG
jgi:hypothetical protein